MVAKRPLTIDASAPQWAARLVHDLEQAYVKASPTAPQRLAPFVSTDLPSASDWISCVIAVTDLGCIAYSNGSSWVRADGSVL